MRRYDHPWFYYPWVTLGVCLLRGFQEILKIRFNLKMPTLPGAQSQPESSPVTIPKSQVPAGLLVEAIESPSPGGVLSWRPRWDAVEGMSQTGMVERFLPRKCGRGAGRWRETASAKAGPSGLCREAHPPGPPLILQGTSTPAPPWLLPRRGCQTCRRKGRVQI